MEGRREQNSLLKVFFFGLRDHGEGTVFTEVSRSQPTVDKGPADASNRGEASV